MGTPARTSLQGRRIAIAAVAALSVILGFAAIASAARTPMVSTRVAPKLCETTGGGKFVAIPGFPGEMIDRRLLADIRWIQKRYPIFITDGYSSDPVHAENGEHPIGLALDIVPDKAAGGTWDDIDRLAIWAEPRQNQPRTPFRWVGYDGDSGHGRGNHLHLSWSHSVTRPGKPAKLVDTIRCPDPIGTATPPATPDPPPPVTSGGATGTGRSGDGHQGGNRHRDHGSRHAGRHGDAQQGPATSSGGIGGTKLAPPAAESHGADLDY